MIGCVKISVGVSARPSASVSSENRAGVSVGVLAKPNVCVSSENRTDVSAGASTRPSLYIERVCKFAQDALLIVSPEFVWLNEGNDYTAEFEVLSNVEWTIE